jgi:tetratricopeptide (TPR) repeat protein
VASSSRARRPRPAPASVRAPSLFLPVALIVAAAIGTYWNGLSGPFIWDDETAIVTNKSIQQLWPPSVPLQPPRETPVAGRPVVNLSFALNYAVGGLTETGYHLGNVALHAVCALLLFALVRGTLDGPGLADRFGRSATGIALVAALLWTVHPIQSEVVNYVTQRTESVMALFYLLTLYAAMRGQEARAGFPQTSQTSTAAAWEVCAVLACAIGMASKESMVTAPLMVLLYDRAFLFDSWRDAFAVRRRLYAGLMATWTMLAFIISQQPRSTAGLATPIGSWTYLLNQAQMIGRYLWLIVWPRTLILDYGVPRQIGLIDVLPAALIVLSLAIAALVVFLRWPRIGILPVAFFLILAPTSSVVPISSEVGAERRVYLSLAAVTIFVAIAAHSWLERREAAGARTRVLSIGVASLVIVALAARTMARTADYASALSLWRTVIEQRPNGRARMSYATELITAGSHDEAISQLREAVADFPDARYGLGTELVIAGQVDEGIAVLRTFIADKPDNLNRIPARLLIGQALATKGRLADAAAELRGLLAIAPKHDGARATLGDVLFAMGRFDDATAEYQALPETLANSPAIAARLGASLLASGRAGEAIVALTKALEQQPGSVPVNRSLAEAYLRQQQPAMAERYAREAVRLAPSDGAAQNILAISLASSGRFEEAVVHFRESLRLNPGDQQAQANLERALHAQAAGHATPH